MSTGWGKKLRAALRPSWLAADTKLAGNPTLDPEEECSYDTGIDLTEADFIADDLDADDSAGYIKQKMRCHCSYIFLH